MPALPTVLWPRLLLIILAHLLFTGLISVFWGRPMPIGIMRLIWIEASFYLFSSDSSGSTRLPFRILLASWSGYNAEWNLGAGLVWLYKTLWLTPWGHPCLTHQNEKEIAGRTTDTKCIMNHQVIKDIHNWSLYGNLLQRHESISKITSVSFHVQVCFREDLLSIHFCSFLFTTSITIFSFVINAMDVLLVITSAFFEFLKDSKAKLPTVPINFYSGRHIVRDT